MDIYTRKISSKFFEEVYQILACRVVNDYILEYKTADFKNLHFKNV